MNPAGRCAILLAGGRASRMGGAPKPLLTVGGSALLRGTLDAVAAAGCAPIVVAGPTLLDEPSVRWVREDPPFGGPVAGHRRGAARRSGTEPVARARHRPAPGGRGGLVPARGGGPLLRSPTACASPTTAAAPSGSTGLYRTAALREASERLTDAGAGASMRDLLADLEIATVAAPGASPPMSTRGRI